MKKVLSFIAIAGLAASIVACGPSKAEIEAKEKATQDSIRIADSTANAAMAAEAAAKAAADSVAAVEAAAKAKATADSLHQDSINKKLIKAPKK